MGLFKKLFGGVDERLETQLQEVSRLRDTCRDRSALRLSQEAARLAQAEHRLIPYLLAKFEIMNVSQSTLEPEVGKAAALEAIALLESPERARRFQSDYPEGHYEHTVGWMSACSYDNLAVATARINGYNSPGMQALIGEGIHICQRTGKLRCITCFRDYASDVHQSADDLEMALHHARTNAARMDPDNDRRWVAAKKESEILMLQGHLAGAWDAGVRAMELVPTYHSPLPAALETRALLREIGCLLGGELSHPPLPAAAANSDVPRDESPEYDLQEDTAAAVLAAAGGRFDQAIELLTEWDRRLTAQKCLHLWFDIRLQLIATMRMAGQMNKAQALARQLEPRAKQACDYLTLRRLKLCLDEAAPAAPIPPAQPYDRGAFAGTRTSVAVAPENLAGAAPAAAKEPKDTPGPLRPVIDGFLQRFEAAGGDESARAAIVDELLRIDPLTVTSDDDGGRLLHVMSLLAEQSGRDGEIWTWAQAMAGRFPDNGPALSMMATIANILRQREGWAQAHGITEDRLREWFRRSMDLVPDGVGTFARAGQFYLSIGDFGEAERCVARAFRLDRGHMGIALLLSKLYSASDRTADALAVVDMCLREGKQEPPLLWTAATLAVSLKRYQVALSYLDAFAPLAPQEPWTQYFRAVSLLALGRPEEAGKAIEIEAARAEGPGLHIAAVRAAVAGALRQPEVVREQLGRLLEIPLSSVQDLGPKDIGQEMERAWEAAATLEPADPIRQRFSDHLLMTAMSCDSQLLSIRQAGAKVKGLSHFVCMLRQPLDQRWASWPGRLAGQETWPMYQIRYGVLAQSQEQARSVALEMQSRCFPLPASVEEVQLLDEGFEDFPGVTVQTLPTSVDEGPENSA